MAGSDPGVGPPPDDVPLWETGGGPGGHAAGGGSGKGPGGSRDGAAGATRGGTRPQPPGVLRCRGALRPGFGTPHAG